MKRKGFTLIELLVVIAIIGILAGIVLVSLGGARTKAKDAAIKANMDSMRLACEMVYTNDPVTGYSPCITDASYLNAKAAAFANGAVWIVDTAPNIGGYFKANGTLYCIQSTLPGTGSWCLDSAGSVGTTAVGCDGTNYNCAP